MYFYFDSQFDSHFDIYFDIYFNSYFDSWFDSSSFSKFYTSLKHPLFVFYFMKSVYEYYIHKSAVKMCLYE